MGNKIFCRQSCLQKFLLFPQTMGTCAKRCDTHLDVRFWVCVRRLCDTECVCVALDPHVCTDALHGIIREGGDVIRIECDYDESQRCVRLYLMVDKERFDQLIEGGRLPAEEHVINLARQVWREVNVPQHCDAEPEPSPLACIDSWNEKHPLSPTKQTV